ncbi:MAG: peptidyl-prolyl cis-trans isomerase [Bacteroidota bacterium]|nr:peptidyl-prolyl cis-trans isomerase [Bacteroidota bacterium]
MKYRCRYRRYVSFFPAIVLALLNLSCGRSAHETNDVARVDNKTLTLDMIRTQLDSSQSISQSAVHLFADRWINSELLYAEAQRQGLDHSPAVEQQLEEARKQLAINALLEKEIFIDTPQSVPEDEVTAYYNDHKNEFRLPDDVVWISFTVFPERKTAANFRSAILSRKDSLVGNGWNANIENFRNHDSSSALLTYSDSVFYTQRTLFPTALWRVARTLGTREVSFPVKTSAGYFVIVSHGLFYKGNVAPLRYVENDIRGRIVMGKRQQRTTQLLESLRKKHVVELNLTDVP